MRLPEHVHFIGIGGAGMAPLAGLLLDRGVKVSGSDLVSSEKSDLLGSRGAEIFTGHRSENFPESAGLTVYSSAVPEDNPERMRGRRLGVPEMRRGEFLALFLSSYRRVAAVSGSHGKSTVTAMLSHICTVCGLAPGYMIGAGVRNGSSCASGEGDDIFITEADESDATHKLLSPYLGIVPNADGDHAWSVGGREALQENFRTFARRSQHVICFDTERELFSGMGHVTFLPHPGDGYTFAGHCGFMALDALLAVESAVYLGCDRSDAERAVSSFGGILRRMTLRSSDARRVVIEDYAHHPCEVKHSLEYLRLKYPGHHLRVVFQPHRYARLEMFFDGFCSELKKADSLFVTPVFAAWSESGKVDGKTLASECGGHYLTGFRREDAAEVLALPHGEKPLLIAVLGAGDVEEIIPYL